MKIKNTEFEIIKGDISQLSVDAVVNPANSGLTVMQKAKYIIPAVVMDDNGKTGEKIIRQAMTTALIRAAELKAHSVAFPALGCGATGFSVVGSAKIMTQEILKHARFYDRPLKKIIFCLFDETVYQTFTQTCGGYIHHIQDTLGEGPYVTVDAIIEMQEGIILIERSNPPYGLALPGGFVDYGESLETAVRREAKEETNLELIDLKQFHVYSEPERDPRFHTVSTVFLAKGKGIPKAGDDAQGVRVVKYDNLLKNAYAFDHKEIIKDYLRFQRGGK